MIEKLYLKLDDKMLLSQKITDGPNLLKKKNLLGNYMEVN